MAIILPDNRELRLNLFLKPTYAVIMPQIDRGKKGFSISQIQNRVNLKNNKHAGYLSKKSQRKLVNTVNWLVASAKKKHVYSKLDRKKYVFRLNFVTLTLPTTNHNISDHYFKSVMLHAFINACRYKFGLKNFVWKVEAQANGNIHAHFTTDTFMHWKALRAVWNKILKSEGLIDDYTNKFSSMTEEHYISYMRLLGYKNVDGLKSMYKKGVESGWCDPNSTDVKSVRKIKDIGAYLAKYMGKEDKERRAIKGRLWSSSYNLARANKTTVSIPVDYDYSFLHF